MAESDNKLIKLLSLNIKHGGGTRVPALLKWIESQNPDFLILPEWRNNSRATQWGSTLEQLGYFTAALSRSGNRDNGVMVASRHPMYTERCTPSCAQKGELFLVESNGLIICGAYFPQGGDKAPFFSTLYSLAAEYAGRPFLIMGDINTGDNTVDLQSGATKFSCSPMFYDLTTCHGMTDLWRRQHGNKEQEWTWLSNSGNGFRIDHAFANREFINSFEHIRCWYDHTTRQAPAQLTDHSAMIVEFQHARAM